MGDRRKKQTVMQATSPHQNLIEQAEASIAEPKYGRYDPRALSDIDRDAIAKIIEEINPQQGAESILAVQVAVAQMIGLYELASTCSDSKRLGLLLIRHACDALQFIDRGRQRFMHATAIEAQPSAPNAN